MKVESKLTQEQEIRVEALRLAILQKEKNGSRFTVSSVAACFEKYIESGAEFRID